VTEAFCYLLSISALLPRTYGRSWCPPWTPAYSVRPPTAPSAWYNHLGVGPGVLGARLAGLSSVKFALTLGSDCVRALGGCYDLGKRAAPLAAPNSPRAQCPSCTPGPTCLQVQFPVTESQGSQRDMRVTGHRCPWLLLAACARAPRNGHRTPAACTPPTLVSPPSPPLLPFILCSGPAGKCCEIVPLAYHGIYTLALNSLG
jgi:hypothetical protein